jgi:CobQ/CobB/MinD/ParA nucleotide binding domain
VKLKAWPTISVRLVLSAWRPEVVETVAFYSYKGGVGRSMLLANAARYLAMHGKGVVALDFDFEAPRLHYKFGWGQYHVGLVGGAVPYLVATADGTLSPPPFDEHMISVPIPTEAGGWLRLMPRGRRLTRATGRRSKSSGIGFD